MGSTARLPIIEPVIKVTGYLLAPPASRMNWLRHSYVTYLLDSGAPLKIAQENAGHSDIGTTMHYRHIAQIDRHEKV